MAKNGEATRLFGARERERERELLALERMVVCRRRCLFWSPRRGWDGFGWKLS